MTTATGFGYALGRPAAARLDQFKADAVTTATPGQLLVRLYDRLLLDIDRAHEAQTAGDHLAAGTQLVHAQAIVSELASTLDVDAWDGGPRLMSIYTFLLAELVRANVEKAPDRTLACRALVAPLAEAWREAASQQGAPPAAQQTGVPAQRISAVG
ncbi:flagellar export chaperone FliS [Aquipuribacter nitratireducens]|uniref:Flagellar export chaperone FliS n=1 Tax=Aquipuribacter nitratireducens TaxID=650104 RepID=A0ABW0GP38_9MICO